MTQNKHGRTSSGVAFNNVVFDRESGRPIAIQCHSFDLVMSGSSLSFSMNSQHLPPDMLMLLLKCLLIIRNLPEAALEEAAEGLEEIHRFYTNRLHRASLPMIHTSSVKGKLRAEQVRPSIVLEP